MTYETALQWSIDNIPTAQFNSFDEWYDALEDNFQTPVLTGSPTFRQMAKDSWIELMGDEMPEATKEQLEEYERYEASKQRPDFIQPPPEQIPRPPPTKEIRVRQVRVEHVETRKIEGRKKEGRITGFLKRLFRRKKKRDKK